MKHTLLAGLTALALTTPALAQTTVTTPAPGPGATVTIAPEQRTRIKQYVVQQKVRPVQIRERVAVGATLPADVNLHRFRASGVRILADIVTSTPMTT